MKRQKQPTFRPTYTLMHELTASPSLPMPRAQREHQLTRMWSGLAAIETAPAPDTDHWRCCSDAVNLMEALVQMQEVDDTSGLLSDAVAALAEAGMRYHRTGVIRLDARGIFAVRSVLEDYADVIEQLPHRTVVRCHRITERRVWEIQHGKRRPHDVVVVSV